MRYRTIPNTDIKLSEIGFGCWTMGGPNWSQHSGEQIGWADVNEDDITSAIKLGIDQGVNHFDNADIYGNGRAERLLAKAINSLAIKRADLVIATKVGHAWGTAPHPYEPHHIRRQCEQSLRNLNTDHIDIYYFHHGSFAPDNQPGNIQDAAAEMHRLVDEGKVRAVGQSAYSDKDFARAIPIVKPNVLQSWAHMLADNFIRPDSKLQQLMAEHNCTFVAFSPLAQGRLLDKFDPQRPPAFDEGDNRNRPSRDGSNPFSKQSLTELQPKMDALKARFGSTTEDLASAALRFILAHDNIASVIPGFRNAKQAACNVGPATDPPFSQEDLTFCRTLFAAD